MPEFKPFEQPVIAQRKVRYVGEPMAMVVADTAALAEDALEAIEVDIEALPVVADRDAARRGDVLAVRGDRHQPRDHVLGACSGDAEAAFRDAPYMRREHFKVQRFTAVLMETRGFVAEWDAARAEAHGVRRSQGGVSQPPHPGEAARACRSKSITHGRERRRRRLRRARRVLSGGFPDPVRVAHARPAGEMDRGPPRASDRDQPRARRRMRARDRLRPRRHHPGLARTRLRRRRRLYAHQRRHRRAQHHRRCCRAPYRIPNIDIDDVAAGHQQDAGRAPIAGRGGSRPIFSASGCSTWRRSDLGIDRVEFRRRNLIAEKPRCPIALATVMPLDMATETDSGDYRMTLRPLSRRNSAGTAKAKLQGKLIDGRYHGIAVGCYFEGGGSGPRENARLVLEADGTVVVSTSARRRSGRASRRCSRRSPPTRSKCRWTASRGVLHGSTDIVSEGFGSYSSRSIVMGGSAILQAAAKAARRDPRRGGASGLAARAAGHRDRAESDAPARTAQSLTFDEFAGLCRRTALMPATSAPTAMARTRRMWRSMPSTGHVAVLDYVAVEDVGRIINPLTLHGQTVGAIVQGLGGALLEHLRL